MGDDVPPDTDTDRNRRRGDPERVKAFTDGVFAIIITILVLEISVPADLGEQGLRRALDEIGPTLWAWVISFLIVGMYWMWHRDLFAQIRSVNRDVVWLNLVFLLPTSLIPFAAALLGEYPDEAIVLRVYGGILMLASFARVAMYWYVIRHPALLFDSPTIRGRRFGLALAAAPVLVYALAMAVAGITPTLSILLYLGLPLMYFVLITLLRKHPETSEDADEYS